MTNNYCKNCIYSKRIATSTSLERGTNGVYLCKKLSGGAVFVINHRKYICNYRIRCGIMGLWDWLRIAITDLIKGLGESGTEKT